MHTFGKWVAVTAAMASLVASNAIAQETAPTELESTVVTATRTTTTLKDAPGAVTVIDADQIKEMAAGDILDIVRESAGISLTGRGAGGRSVISIRGMNSHHALILVDGKRVAASDAVFGHSDFEHNWVPLEQIERIEVVRGPLSALYGSEAMGGVINIITKKASSQWHGSLKVGGGLRSDGDGGETQNYAVQVSGPLVEEKLGLDFSAEYNRENDSPDPDKPAYSDLEGKEVITTGLRFTFKPTAGHQFEAGLNYTEDDRWRYASRRGKDYTQEYELEKAAYNIGWQANWGPLVTRLNAYRSDIDKLSRKRYDSGRLDDNPEQLTNDVLDAQASFPLGPNLVTFGGELRKETLETENLQGNEDDASHNAVFLQDEISLFADRLLLTPGLRVDDHENFGSETSPRIYALYKPTDRINLKAGYGHSFRAPTIKQSSSGYHATMGRRVELFGSPDVKPETTDAFEAGVEYHSDWLFARAMYFHNEIEDLIDWQEFQKVGRVSHRRPTNIAEACTRGVETEFNLKLPHGFKLGGSYTYLDARDTEKDERLDEKPRHTLNVKLKYTLEEYGFGATLRMQYIADQVLLNDDDNLQDAPDYSLWHFSLRQEFLENFEAQVGVENITDVRLADKSELYDHEERGRFFYANLRYAF